MKKIYLSLILLCALSACSSSDDDVTKDMTAPEISSEGSVAGPIDGQVFKRGDVIPFNYLFTDDTELGAYNIEIHNNFDHHTHSTTSTDCALDAEKKATAKAWVYNKDFTIPAGMRSYTARHDIAIPADIDPGDYHFMIRLTDRSGWQKLHAVAVKITE